jgi:hypothetical protein
VCVIIAAFLTYETATILFRGIVHIILLWCVGGRCERVGGEGVRGEGMRREVRSEGRRRMRGERG